MTEFELKLVKELKEKLGPNERIEDFLPAIIGADEKVDTLIKENNMFPTKASHMIEYQMDSDEFAKNIDRAKMGDYYDALKANPRYVVRDGNETLKKVNETIAANIPLKDENGKYNPQIFSNRLHLYVLEQSGNLEKSSGETQTIDIGEVLQLAYRLLEELSLDDKKEEVASKLDAIKDKGLSTKEMLMEVTKGYADNLEFLSSKIDELLEYEKSLGMGRVA